ncbi:glutathione synthase/RimK-type ligase-like ATP-grasp enzyme [Caulobacter ginsengisoli]|uniref:Glutathione synthase/RimK-type ligase-like ATP-grasp enzyme n=1 Tax=Caulobacter ginsengisoli TaxID=400775 RepID=A0ABU0IW71_9CAUL|nr:transporter [Caulobacter ginsengisoli]MDQ0465269.1 glutathione synthase/RimK-type ligase-like ATP-grasp enzyme [Caulobacter ginsengisoli]
MTRIAILSPTADNPMYGAIYPRWFKRLEAALATAGLTAEAAPWTQPFDPAPYAAVLPMMAWGYHQHTDQWFALLDRLEASGVTVLNPVETLRWNTAKTYLLDLAAHGAPVIPTLAVEAVTPAAIEAARASFGVADLVAKPQISAGAHRTVVLRPGDPLDGAPTGAALIQPFLPAVREEGELAVFWFGGRFSHAVSKVAAPGEFRVQAQYGGQETLVDPTPEALAAAQAVFKAAARPITYCRIDLIRALDGRLALMELEAIEPDLFLEHAPDGGAMFGAAVRAALTL